MAKNDNKKPESGTEPTPPETQPTPSESKSETKTKLSHKLSILKERQGQ